MAKAGEGRRDHRARLTRKMIKDALLALMAEKPVADVTVTELCNAAEVSRSTFYAHYSTPEDVYDEMLDEVIADMGAFSADEGLDAYEAMLGICEACLRHRDFTLMSVRDARTGAALNAKMLSLSSRFSKLSILPDNPTAEQSRERFRAVAISRGATGIVYDWHERGLVEPPELVARAIADFAKSVGAE